MSKIALIICFDALRLHIALRGHPVRLDIKIKLNHGTPILFAGLRAPSLAYSLSVYIYFRTKDLQYFIILDAKMLE